MSARVWLASALVALAALAGSARAQQVELIVLLDLDRDVATGCGHDSADGAVYGIELLVRAQVDLALEQVVSVTHAACANPVTHEFGPAQAASGMASAPWAIVTGDGTSGSSLIEAYLPLSAVPGATVAHAHIVLQSPAGGYALRSTAGTADGEAIAIALGAPEVPALSQRVLALLAAMLASALALRISASRRRALAAALIAVLALPSPARASLGDGALRTWSPSERVATDPGGDAPEGADILAAFAFVDEAHDALVIRVDALLGPAVCLDWPSVDPGSGYSCSQEPPPDPGPFANRVALTFDDGPSLETTPTIVATLRAESVPATFFMKGLSLESEAARALALEIHADPLFEVANHSYTHPFFTALSLAQMRDEIASTNAALRLALGDPCFDPRFFRIPYSASNCAAAGAVREHGLSMVGLHTDSLDWCYAAGGGFCSPALVPGLASQYRNDMVAWVQFKLAQTGGGIVLLHDIHANTAAQLPGLIAALRAGGASFVRLDDASVFPLVNAAVNPPEAPACCLLDPP